MFKAFEMIMINAIGVFFRIGIFLIRNIDIILKSKCVLLITFHMCAYICVSYIPFELFNIHATFFAKLKYAYIVSILTDENTENFVIPQTTILEQVTLFKPFQLFTSRFFKKSDVNVIFQTSFFLFNFDL